MGQTSIPCNTEVRDRLAGDKPDEMSWSEYLSVLHSDQEITVEPDTSIDGIDIDEAIADLEGGLTYDDVVNATRKAIREELPDGVFR